MAKMKKLNLKVLKEEVRYNLGDDIQISKSGDNLTVYFPNYNNPNIKIVNVKKSAPGKATFGTVAVNSKGFGTVNVQVFKQFDQEQEKLDENGNVIKTNDPTYFFRCNNQPISRSQQSGLAQVIDSDKEKIIKMLEYNPEESSFETWACENLINKNPGTYQNGDLDFILQDYKDSSPAYKSIMNQKARGRKLSEAQENVIRNIEDKFNAGISRLTVKYGKRTLAQYDFDTKLGAITTNESDDTEATETVDLSEESDEI